MITKYALAIVVMVVFLSVSIEVIHSLFLCNAIINTTSFVLPNANHSRQPTAQQLGGRLERVVRKFSQTCIPSKGSAKYQD